MKNVLKIFIIIIIFVVISTFLYITGKKHEAIIENNYTSAVKYSVDGEPYKVLDINKKARIVYKGISSVIFIKTEDGKVIEKDLSSNSENLEVSNIINSF